MNGFIPGLVIGACGGGAIIWLFKLQLQKLFMDGNALATKLRAQADAIAVAFTPKK